MKIIINRNFGGFKIPEEMVPVLGVDCWDDGIDIRTNAALIKWVEAHPKTPLRVVEVPDHSTDMDILEYDGMESVVCVIDGRLKYIAR